MVVVAAVLLLLVRCGLVGSLLDGGECADVCELWMCVQNEWLDMRKGIRQT